MNLMNIIMVLCASSNSWLIFKWRNIQSVVSFSDPTLEEGKGSSDINFINERFLGSCKLSILICESQSDCSSMIIMWPCIWSHSNDTSWQCSASQWECSSMVFALYCIHVAMWDWHMGDCIILLAWSHAPVRPRNRSNVTRPFPAWELGAGYETI